MAPAAREPDIIIRQSIPLAATTDQPLAAVPRPPESASNDPIDQQAGTSKEISPEDAAVAEAARKGALEAEPAEGSDPNPDGADPKPAKTEDPDTDGIPKDLPGYAVREISKARKTARLAREAATAEAETARAEAKAARDAAAEAQRALEELKAKAAPEPAKEPEAADVRPSRDQFDDPDAYDTALTDWARREGIRTAEAQATEQRKAQETEAARLAGEKEKADQEEAARTAHASWMTKVEAAVEKHPDYRELVEKAPAEGGPSISPVMAMAIQKADNGTDVAYHLAQDVEESRRIASITDPVMQLLEIGGLIHRLANPPRRQRQAAPIEPIDTTRSPAGEDQAEPDMEAYAAKRQLELMREARPFFPKSELH